MKRTSVSLRERAIAIVLHAGAQTLLLNVTADVVPEPSTLALLCVVGAVLWARSFRRKRRL